MRHGSFCDRAFAFGVSGVLGEREVALEFEWGVVAESRAEALGIGDGVNEAANGTSCVIDVPESAALDFFRSQRFMKLAAVALSLGFPGLLMLTVISCRAE